jgi:hypothetical protein
MRTPTALFSASRQTRLRARLAQILALAVTLPLLAACTPTVRVEAPDKPIEINMNVNIRHEILIKVEQEVEEMFENEELF